MFLAIAAGKVGGQILENVIRPGKQSGPDFKGLGNQLTESLEKADKEVKSVTKMKRRSDGSMAKLKGQSFMKRMKMMNEASPMQFGPKRKTTKKKLPVDPLNVKGKIKKTADAAVKEMKNLISNVRNIAKTDVPRAVAGDAKKLLNKIGKFVKTSKSRKSGGIFGK